ncbi:hypothetical protein BDP27DRAFT_1373788 [Rhodocollybia butyracea]|uniref:Secreted protein n=1 Tax=Rhodocollybia butyracea TaxID=206335 RepID=A0A9P5P5K2_9AGAR|nr:hypothetical protein BDP27DRAFT_1373788 [Rhodocollybia butyracea]
MAFQLEIPCAVCILLWMDCGFRVLGLSSSTGHTTKFVPHSLSFSLSTSSYYIKRTTPMVEAPVFCAGVSSSVASPAEVPVARHVAVMTVGSVTRPAAALETPLESPPAVPVSMPTTLAAIPVTTADNTAVEALPTLATFDVEDAVAPAALTGSTDHFMDSVSAEPGNDHFSMEVSAGSSPEASLSASASPHGRGADRL